MKRIWKLAVPTVALLAALAAIVAIVALPQAAQAKPDCNCLDVWRPVCGTNGVTYSNSCYAGCAGVPIAYHDECGGGSTSFAAIFAEAAEAQPASGAAAPVAVAARCICPDVYAPVCGVNGVTYSNSCRARCAGVAIAHNGACGSTS